MHETPADLAELQDLLDCSYAAAGSHLLEVITPIRRIGARELADRLTGMRLLVLATVTADVRPLAGPVDGIFYRGAFHFGSAPDSVRVRHIRRRRAVSATHLPSEDFAVTVHGAATILDMRADEHAELRRTVLDVYEPQYGAEFGSFLDANVFARIDPVRMFTFQQTERPGELS